MKNIWAVVLAAGESVRMGSPKMLLPYRGKTIIENVIEKIIRSDINNIVLVLGADSEKIIKVVDRMPVRCCYNKNYKTGMLSSVICGFEFLPDDFYAAMVFPGDLSSPDTDIINLMIKLYLESGKGIIVPVHNGRRGHPLLVDRKYGAEIVKLDPEKGLRSLLEKFSGDILEVPAGSDSILKDIDTPEDYMRETNHL
jgi:molybdenum cofactor cytidylyltransferase